MEDKFNPALAAFLGTFAEERVWAEVLIRRQGPVFELRHVNDREAVNLRCVSVGDLRQLSQYNPLGQFRPLKSAPDLPTGWRALCQSSSELWRALQEVYPGSIPDWFATQSAAPPVTSYREFTNRQTGMYRIAQLHSGEQAALVISGCCAPHLCLKQRLWTVEGLTPDTPECKSAIPCLEPCALLLELARKSARIEQEEKLPLQVSGSDWETLAAAAEYLAKNPPAEVRAGDTGSPLNPRRLQLIFEKLQIKLASR